MKALEILADKAYEKCGRKNDAGQALRLISLEKEARRYADGYSDGVTEFLFLQLARRIFEQAKKCARFELQFESVVSYLDDDNDSESHVRATVPIQLYPAKTPLAESPLEYVSFSYSNPQCRTDPDCCPTRVGGTHGSTFKVIDTVRQVCGRNRVGNNHARPVPQAGVVQQRTKENGRAALTRPFELRATPAGRHHDERTETESNDANLGVVNDPNQHAA